MMRAPSKAIVRVWADVTAAKPHKNKRIRSIEEIPSIVATKNGLFGSRYDWVMSTSEAATLITPGKKVALVGASWHSDMVEISRNSCREEFRRQGINPDQCTDAYDVPGSLEIPITALKLAQTGRYSAVIAFGFVVNGGIYRHEFVAQAVIDGLMRAQMETGVPVLSAVLTPINFHEHEAHTEFFRGHMVKKGQEAARACLGVLATLQQISSLR
jgi:6,7-dimethyl-8-ribityllumazine synthase